MRAATTIVFLLVLAANAQKSAPRKPATTPLQMSHDFRTAGRRAVTAISHLKLEGEASKAIDEAGAQHDNAVDKQAIELLKEYNRATVDALLHRVAPASWCTAGACDAMYATCKKESEQAFETGLLPAKSQCKSLSPRAPNDHSEIQIEPLPRRPTR
jgi:hypothetical protein